MSNNNENVMYISLAIRKGTEEKPYGVVELHRTCGKDPIKQDGDIYHQRIAEIPNDEKSGVLALEVTLEDTITNTECENREHVSDLEWYFKMYKLTKSMYWFWLYLDKLNCVLKETLQLNILKKEYNIWNAKRLPSKYRVDSDYQIIKLARMINRTTKLLEYIDNNMDSTSLAAEVCELQEKLYVADELTNPFF